MAKAAPFPIPEAALAHHVAVLGKTGSGKTSTGKVLVEHFFATGDRVCILDPIKSDWWGLTSNAAGDGPGLPFVILGGPRGHTPLSSSAGKLVGQLVADGRLRHVIVDMADFEPGGPARFFVDFAEVLLRQIRGVVHLVVEEAHEFAPKERAGIGAENLSVHWAKKLATAGRSKGVRLLMATQATQSLHNGLLGSCETVIVHRLTLPAQQKPVLDWLKANAERELVAEIAESLSSLPTGVGWVCSGEAKIFSRVPFPRIATFDNSATPTGDMAVADVRTAPVDVAALRLLLAAPTAETTGKSGQAAAAAPSSGQLEAARQAGYDEGYRLGLSEGERREWRRHMMASHAEQTARLEELNAQLERVTAAIDRPAEKKPDRRPGALPAAQQPGLAPGAVGLIQAAARVHPTALTWGQIATLAGRKPRGGHFNGSKKSALDHGLLIERDGLVRVTEAGLAAAGVEATSGPVADVWAQTLPQPAAKMFAVLRKHPEIGITPLEMASVLQMQPRGGHWNSGMATLKRNGLVREDGGRLILAEFLE